MTRQINAEGLAIIKQFEGCKLTAYTCPAGVLTVGFGHTGPDVKPGMTITQAQADDLLRADLAKFEAGVDKLVGPDCTDNRFSALVSFSYNVGLANLEESTLLKFHLQKKYGLAEMQFARWTRANGKVLPGLVKRRAQEAALYAKG